MPTRKHKESGESTVRLSVSTNCQGVQTDSDYIFSKARFLSDNSKVLYCTGLPVCEMLRLAFDFVLIGIGFWWGKTRILLQVII